MESSLVLNFGGCNFEEQQQKYPKLNTVNSGFRLKTGDLNVRRE